MVPWSKAVVFRVFLELLMTGNWKGIKIYFVVAREKTTFLVG